METEFQNQYEDVSKMSAEEFSLAYKKLSDALETPETDIPLHAWVLLSCYGAEGMKTAVRAVHDAYKLGYQMGKAICKQEEVQ
ncbi:MAG: hypothetical protein LUD14_10575 [Clostridiales bacterium]|nr:hypothetical protein [Clostridiales bacterium]